MPKKQRNAFYFFMKEKQEKYNVVGKRVSMKELVNECHPIFKNLSLSDKERYEQMAVEYKNHVKETTDGHLCSDGTVLALNNQVELERREAMENETKAVKRMVFGMKSVDELVDKAFYVVCFNVLCRTDDDDYIPNEVGVVKYSLKLGIEEHYHCFIDPGAIPLGYTHASKQHSEDTHLIPITGFDRAKRNYQAIYKDIVDFVNPRNKVLAPVFCLKESLEQNRGCIQWLALKAGQLDDGPIHFYDITLLLMELRAYVGKAFPSRAVAVDFLSNHAFDYTPNTSCGYHEGLDNAYCALGYAKRLCFMLSDALCALYDVDCTSNHLPPRVSDKGQMETSQPMFPSSRLFIPPNLSRPYVNSARVPNVSIKLGDTASPLKNSSTDRDQSWIKEFHQPEPDMSADFPPQNSTKPGRHEEMRQPSTVPFVLNHGAKTQYALLGRGRGIGRGKQPPVN